MSQRNLSLNLGQVEISYRNSCGFSRYGLYHASAFPFNRVPEHSDLFSIRIVSTRLKLKDELELIDKTAEIPSLFRQTCPEDWLWVPELKREYFQKSYFPALACWQ
ncbi:hypothetical protein BASA81_014417 [Batrachochytrium salamandrivorans]|nr:hypothetical protein BASA81_014417 [Batrachochytrium salamandrivorans]